MIYRVIETLSVEGGRLQRGTLNKLEMLSSKCIEALLAKNRISEVHPPPLAILPDWEARADMYAERGIKNVVDLVDDPDADEEDVEEALKWIQAPTDSHIGGGPLSHYVWEVEASEVEGTDEVGS